MKIDSIYEATPIAEQIVQTITLRAVEWRLLMVIGQMQGLTVRQIAADLSLSPEAAELTVERLVGMDLIHDPETTWAYFASRFPNIAAPAPAPPPEVNEPGKSAREKPAIRGTIRRKSSSIEAVGASPMEPVKLKPLLDFIRQRAGGGSLGQMAVYRVFLKISPDLLKRSGLETVNLDDESTRIEDRALIAELLRAIREVVGESYPAYPESTAAAA